MLNGDPLQTERAIAFKAGRGFTKMVAVNVCPVQPSALGSNNSVLDCREDVALDNVPLIVETGGNQLLPSHCLNNVPGGTVPLMPVTGEMV